MNSAFVSSVPVSATSFAPAAHSLCRAPRLTTPTRRPVPTAQFNPLNFKLPDIKLPDLKILDVDFGPLRKSLAIAAVTFALVASSPDESLAARSGGRVGGSSFRSAPPAASRMAPGGPSYGGGGGMGYGYGYGAPSLFLNPFIMPFGGFGLGFGGLGTLLLLSALVSILSSAARTATDAATGEGGAASDFASTRNTVISLKLGLLANARSLQADLDSLARSADTTTPSGLNYVLQNAVVALLRTPDYWAYAAVDTSSVRQSEVEAEFNRIALEERLKLDEETLVNSAGNTVVTDAANATQQDMSQAPSEFVVVNLIVAAADGSLTTKLPKVVDGVTDVDRALKALGGVTKDSIQAVEIIWAPQSMRDTLSKQEMLQDHPELKAL